MEWAVLARCRGEGVGKALMAALLGQRLESYAVLTVNPAAPAREIYTRAGWQHVATTSASSKWPAMDVMLLEIASLDLG